MMKFKIPLTDGSQKFTITLNDTLYEFSLIYRYCSDGIGGWFFDMVDVQTNRAIRGQRLVVGVDLLEQFQHMSFGHLVAKLDAKSENEYPTFSDMGRNIELVWSE